MIDTGERLRLLLETLVTAIAENKDAVVVGVSEGGNEVTLEVTVAPEDMGRVIGRKGRVASAMRTIVRAGAGETGVNIEIKEY